MKNIILLVALILSGMTSRAQTDRYIEVIGSAEAEIVPNLITVSVLLREYEVNKQKVALDQIEKKFFAACDKSMIDRKNVSLSNLFAGALTPKRRDRELFASKTYSIIVTKTQRLNEFLINLADTKPEDVSIGKLDHTDLEKLRLDVKIAALKAAEKKADAMLASIAAKRGKVLLIQEPQEQPGGWTMYPPSNISWRASNRDEGSDSAIPFKNITLYYSIIARFQIE